MLLNKQHKTAILVFANSSQEEVKHKPIANGEKLFESLTSKTLDTVAKSKLPYFRFSEAQQTGNTFGERFTNAIQSIFNKGFEQVITIGNDSPQLTVSHILEAEKQLNNNNFVLGPSTDGGFYLMGMKKVQFNASAFQKLDWQTATLSKQLLRLVTTAQVSVVRLETLFDIDTVRDIKSIITYAYQLPETILKVLLAILNTQKIKYSHTSLFYNKLHSNTYHNKGSPVLLQL